MKRQALDQIVDDHLAAQLRRDGPLIDVEIHADCGDAVCPPVRGRALVDSGADRTAVEFTELDPRARSTGTYWAQGVTSEVVPLPIYPLRVSIPGGGSVEVDRAAATPHLRSQGLIALIGRDVLGRGQFAYDGPSGRWSLSLPRGRTHVGEPTNLLPWAIGGGALLAAVGAWFLWPDARPSSAPMQKTVGGAGSSGARAVNLPIDDFLLRFVNNFPDSEYLGVSFPGLCGGMTFTALDYARAGMHALKTTQTPSTDSVLGAYIHGRQVQSLAANGTTFLSLLADPLDDIVADRTSSEFESLRGSIDVGAPVPLGLVPPWTLDVTNAHQVLARGYAVDGAGNKTVYLWDPNYPAATAALFQAAGDTLWRESGGGSRGTWRGFFVEDYEPATPPAA